MMVSVGKGSDINRKIIIALQNRQTLSLKDLTIPGITHRSLLRRIRRMKKQGQIGRWTILVNPFALGLSEVVFFLAKTNPREPELLQRIQNKFTEDLFGLYGITGEFSLLGRFAYKERRDFLGKLRDIDKLMADTRLQKYEVWEGLDVFKEYGYRREIPATLSENSKKVLAAAFKLGSVTELPPTTVELARETNLSQPTISRLIRSMQRKRIILGFSVDSSLDFAPQTDLRLFLQLKVSPGVLNEVVSHLISLPEVISLYRTGHSYPLLAELRVESVASYNSLLQSIYASQEGLVDTETMFVLEQIVHRIPVKISAPQSP
ncbi:MAG: Lrp/AsnC ligand binding domain-containing protein [Candidatus Hodarchaeota archaeon]